MSRVPETRSEVTEDYNVFFTRQIQYTPPCSHSVLPTKLQFIEDLRRLDIQNDANI